MDSSADRWEACISKYININCFSEIKKALSQNGKLISCSRFRCHLFAAGVTQI